MEIYFTGSQGLNFKNRKLHIKENFSSGSTAFHMWGNDSQIIIGKDCMFSSEIKIMSGDAHIILDKNSKKYLKNNEKNICELGDHVWVGMRNIICKNAKIPDNCIVGAGSVVSKKFDTKNCVIAGNPAKIIKKEVDWSRAASEN